MENLFRILVSLSAVILLVMLILGFGIVIPARMGVFSHPTVFTGTVINIIPDDNRQSSRYKIVLRENGREGPDVILSHSACAQGHDITFEAQWSSSSLINSLLGAPVVVKVSCM